MPSDSSLAQVEYHEVLMADAPRVIGLAAALRKTVRPGMVVLDVGTGSGWMAILAAKLGARRVYAVERGSIGAIAGEAIRRNGVADRVVLLRDDLDAVRLPERADLMVSETVGNFAWNEDLIRLAGIARKRLLRRGARIIPQEAGLRIVPVGSTGSTGLSRTVQALDGIDLTPLFRAREHRPLLLRDEVPDPLADPRSMFRWNPARDPLPRFPWTRSAVWQVREAAPVAAFGGWVEGRWTAGLSFSTRTPSSWLPFLLLVRPGLRVGKGERLGFDMTFVTAERMQWAVTLNGVPWSRHDTALADPRTAAQARLRPSSIPRLTLPARRRGAILSAADGRTAVASILRKMSRHPVFRDLDAAEVRKLVITTLADQLPGI